MTHTAFPRRARWIGFGVLAVMTAGFLRWGQAADHIDSPLVTDDAGADIADVYSFESPTNPDNLVLIMTLHGFVAPTENDISLFDPNVLYQFKIDNDGDAVEDLVVQAFVTGNGPSQVMHVRGPVTPGVTGDLAEIVNGPVTSVQVSRSSTPIVRTKGDLTVFGGVRDDPFFFDFGAFSSIVGGAATSFTDPGTDSFAGFNVYGIVIELPKALLGGSNLGIWGTTSR